jgi:hypothetical protein
VIAGHADDVDDDDDDDDDEHPRAVTHICWMGDRVSILFNLDVSQASAAEPTRFVVVELLQPSFCS